ncbi:MAG: winged helix-turn-helix domain-containing protein [Chromatiales bacterium]|nr:winged helix-turn-helix domain-containing protein [Chromatiales bacterium]
MITHAGPATPHAPLSVDASIRIGDWDLDPVLNQLRSGDRIKRLEPKAVAVLLELARSPGTVLTRETLIERIWPGLIVSDDVLTQVITKLRRALGDSARAASYVETIPKRGYRLLVPVGQSATGGQEPAAESSARTMPGPVARSRRLHFPALTAIAIVLSIGSAYVWLSHPTTRDIELEDLPLVEIDPGATVQIEPFRALIDEQPQEDLARGLTADLRTDLGRVDGLWVLSGDISAERPGGTARYSVNGSVQRNADHMQVHARLIDTRNGVQIWAQRYDRPITDLFEVQGEISADLTRALSREVSAAELRRQARHYTRNLEAYALFQRAQANLLVRGRDANERARALYRRAIELDPNFARAYAGLALTFAADFRNQWVTDSAAALEQAQLTARTAAGIDPEIAEVDWVIAYVHAQRREHTDAVARLRHALELHRSFADGYALLGGVETYRGRPQRSISLLRTAIRLRPDAGYLYYVLLGRAYFFLGNLEQAAINLRQALARNSQNVEAHVYLAAVLNEQGDAEDAAWELEEIRELDPDFALERWLRTYPMTDKNQLQRLRDSLSPGR